MRITVTIPDELAAQVQARGVVLETYVRDLVEQDLSQGPANDDQRRTAVSAMLQFAEKHGMKLGGQDLKSTIHEGHKY